MSITADDIVKIVKVCKQANIKSLKYQDLAIEFEAAPQDINYTIGMDSLSPRVQAKGAVEEEQLSFDKMEVETKQEYIDRLMIEDPATFEQLVTEGELGRKEEKA